MEISAAALGAAFATTPTPAPAAAAQPASPSATARFEQIMSATPPPPDLAGAASVVGASGFVAPANPSLGDNILAGMQNLSTDFQQSWKSVNAALEAGSNMTTTDMLKLQLGLTQMSVQYDLIGKAISRSTQNLDQLVKLQ